MANGSIKLLHTQIDALRAQVARLTEAGEALQYAVTDRVFWKTWADAQEQWKAALRATPADALVWLERERSIARAEALVECGRELPKELCGIWRVAQLRKEAEAGNVRTT